MNFAELLKKIKQLNFGEKRSDTSDYLELVIHRDRMDKLEEILKDYFGPPFKPAGKNPTKEALQHSAQYGGVWKDQTLYYAERDGFASGVMMWPWSDGERTTVKIIHDLSKKLQV